MNVNTKGGIRVNLTEAFGRTKAIPNSWLVVLVANLCALAVVTSFPPWQYQLENRIEPLGRRAFWSRPTVVEAERALGIPSFEQRRKAADEAYRNHKRIDAQLAAEHPYLRDHPIDSESQAIIDGLDKAFRPPAVHPRGEVAIQADRFVHEITITILLSCILAVASTLRVNYSAAIVHVRSHWKKAVQWITPKRIVFGGVVLLIMAVAFPPWRYPWLEGGPFPGGFGPIWAPPQHKWTVAHTLPDGWPPPLRRRLNGEYDLRDHYLDGYPLHADSVDRIMAEHDTRINAAPTQIVFEPTDLQVETVHAISPVGIDAYRLTAEIIGIIGATIGHTSPCRQGIETELTRG